MVLGECGSIHDTIVSRFDANAMVVSKMPMWVRLHNLPLHFWHHNVLAGIGNYLGKFLKVDANRVSKGFFMFARICVELDLSKGLPDRILLFHNNQWWSQPLDYDNTTLCCCTCLQTGYLQSSRPQVKKDPKRKKRQHQNLKGWKFSKTQEAETDDVETKEDTTNISPQKP